MGKRAAPRGAARLPITAANVHEGNFVVKLNRTFKHQPLRCLKTAGAREKNVVSLAHVQAGRSVARESGRLASRRFFMRVLSCTLIISAAVGTGQAVQQDERGLGVKKTEAPSRDNTKPPAVSPTEQPELVLQTGHASKVDAICFDPAGRLLASGGSDNTIKIWDVGSGRELRTLRGHGAGVAALSFSGDGALLVSGGNDRTVRVWEVAAGRELALLKGQPASIKAVAFHPGGRLIALGGSDNMVRLCGFFSVGRCAPTRRTRGVGCRPRLQSRRTAAGVREPRRNSQALGCL